MRKQNEEKKYIPIALPHVFTSQMKKLKINVLSLVKNWEITVILNVTASNHYHDIYLEFVG